MKVSPMIQGSATANGAEGQSAGPDRIARAIAVASGQPAEQAQPSPDPQVERTQNTIKRLKMRTQVSPDRHNIVQEPVQQNATAPTPSDTLAINEEAVSEATKPLSPQFAALAKQKRALQLQEQALLAKEKALGTQESDKKSLEDYRARIKANALSVLQEEGVTYDQLTEQILATDQSSVDLSTLKAEIKALKEGFENQTKSLNERDAAADKQALNQMRHDTEQLIAQGDDYEMIREAGYAPKVVELVDRVFKKEGKLLDLEEAASLVEKELLEESLKFAKIKKVQSRLNPVAQQQQPVQQDRPGVKVMKTLTNRDGTSSVAMSKRERAIAAMQGRLK